MKHDAKPQGGILSSPSSMRFFTGELDENRIIDVLSDLKHRVFPRPFERLSPLRGAQGLVGAEIGVCGGEHALSLLRTLEPDRLYCIDPYSIYETYDEGRSHYGIDQTPLDETEKKARALLAPHADKIVWVRRLSSEAAVEIREQLDFVYIDGNHAESFVREDIRAYWPLLRRGGVLGGHDYYNGFQSEHDGVIAAVIEFAVDNGLKLKVELPDWWIVKS